LLRIHPVTSVYLDACDRHHFISDYRAPGQFRIDMSPAIGYELSFSFHIATDWADIGRQRDYILDFADRSLGGLEDQWELFWSLATKVGASAGYFYCQINTIHTDWLGRDDADTLALEAEILEYKRGQFDRLLLSLDRDERRGIDYDAMINGFKSRSGRVDTFLRPIKYYLIEEFSRRILDDPRLSETVRESTERTLELRTCEGCGRIYQMFVAMPLCDDIPELLESCCMDCPTGNPTDEEIPALINKLADACGFYPNKNFLITKPDTVDRIGRERFPRAYAAYQEINFITTAFKYMGGNWRAAVKHAKGL
jgi:hypothetical protein